MFLASALILPVGMSYAQTTNVTASTPSVQTMSNQTSANQTMTVQPSPSSNQTMIQSTNTTVSQTNNTKDAQQVSDFIHQAVVDFKKQGDDTRQVIFDCRDKLQTATSGDANKVRQDCTTQLSAIKAKYQDERSHFHDLVKQYRQSVMVFLNDARGTIQVSKADLDKAVTQLGMMMHPGTMGHGMTGLMATKNNTKCINPPGGPAIC